MTTATKIFGLFLFFLGGFAFGQMDTYHQKMELGGVSEPWHKIVLPDAVFGEISNDLSDIRIYGITTANDTIEAPYLLRMTDEKSNDKTVNFNLLNTSRNADAYYFTYEIPTGEPIDQIQLALGNENFDWRIKLEGSQDQNQWFTLLEDYRILSIKTGTTEYLFTDLNLPPAKYRYYRIGIPGTEKPELNGAKIILRETIAAETQDYSIGHMVVNNSDNNETIIDIDLKKRVPLSSLKIEVGDKVDYYRPVSIRYVTDSVATEKGLKYRYGDLGSGILNSIEGNAFKFRSTILQKLQITIANHDNRPLKIQGVEAKGYKYELLARFTEPATYYLTYGNPTARRPQYDISKTTANIPDNLTKLTLGKAQQIPQKEIPAIEPLFKNKIWLWAVMGVVILVLGWLTIGMIRK